MDVTVGIPTRNRSGWLRQAIASVLRQSYENFVLIVSDNASTDDTGEVVASFDDPRIRYSRVEHDLGSIGNLNRLIGLAETDFLVVLCDDDALHPEHLALTREALERWPTAGVAHTGSRVVDQKGGTVTPHLRLMETDELMTFERRDDFLLRSMASVPVCFSSALARRAALVDAGGLRQDEHPFADIPLWMRVACNWDFVYVNEPLTVCRTHEQAESASMGWWTPDGFQWSREFPDLLFERRRSFLRQAQFEPDELSRLEKAVDRAYRRDRLSYLSMRSLRGGGVRTSLRALRHEIRRDRSLALEPFTWRFVAGQLGGRRVRQAIRHLRA